MREHVGGVPSFSRHFLLTEFADREAVTQNQPRRVSRVTEILPHGRLHLPRRRMKVRRACVQLQDERAQDFLLEGKTWLKIQNVPEKPHTSKHDHLIIKQ